MVKATLSKPFQPFSNCLKFLTPENPLDKAFIQTDDKPEKILSQKAKIKISKYAGICKGFFRESPNFEALRRNGGESFELFAKAPRFELISVCL